MSLMCLYGDIRTNRYRDLEISEQKVIFQSFYLEIGVVILGIVVTENPRSKHLIVFAIAVQDSYGLRFRRIGLYA
jgi:hypothetical protein